MEDLTPELDFVPQEPIDRRRLGPLQEHSESLKSECLRRINGADGGQGEPRFSAGVTLWDVNRNQLNVAVVRGTSSGDRVVIIEVDRNVEYSRALKGKAIFAKVEPDGTQSVVSVPNLKSLEERIAKASDRRQPRREII